MSKVARVVDVDGVRTLLPTDVHLTNYMFDGARADLSKNLNMNPAFQVTHSFTLGASQPSPMGGPSTPGGPGTYNFGALYATNRVSGSFTQRGTFAT